ncbi:MAG: PA14 domain-containing protein [Lentisphaeria bacterium]|nr:PA14 domain-containing protein [Lentisphaeria bacterium]
MTWTPFIPVSILILLFILGTYYAYKKLKRAKGLLVVHYTNLTLLFLLLLNPGWVQEVKKEKRKQVLFLIDNSASMSVRDEYSASTAIKMAEKFGGLNPNLQFNEFYHMSKVTNESILSLNKMFFESSKEISQQDATKLNSMEKQVAIGLQNLTLAAQAIDYLKADKKNYSISLDQLSPGVVVDRWNNTQEGGTSQKILLENYPFRPDKRVIMDTLEIPNNSGDHYWLRMHGFMLAPETGFYRFALSGDNRCEFSISSTPYSKGLKRICSINDWTPYNSFQKYASQLSELIHLEKGKLYLFEGLLQEDIINDHYTVRWTMPGKDELSIIPENTFYYDPIALKEENPQLQFPVELQLLKNLTTKVIIDFQQYRSSGHSIKLKEKLLASLQKISEQLLRLQSLSDQLMLLGSSVEVIDKIKYWQSITRNLLVRHLIFDKKNGILNQLQGDPLYLIATLNKSLGSATTNNFDQIKFDLTSSPLTMRLREVLTDPAYDDLDTIFLFSDGLNSKDTNIQIIEEQLKLRDIDMVSVVIGKQNTVFDMELTEISYPRYKAKQSIIPLKIQFQGYPRTDELLSVSTKQVSGTELFQLGSTELESGNLLVSVLSNNLENEFLDIKLEAIPDKQATKKNKQKYFSIPLIDNKNKVLYFSPKITNLYEYINKQYPNQITWLKTTAKDNENKILEQFKAHDVWILDFLDWKRFSVDFQENLLAELEAKAHSVILLRSHLGRPLNWAEMLRYIIKRRKTLSENTINHERRTSAFFHSQFSNFWNLTTGIYKTENLYVQGTIIPRTHFENRLFPLMKNAKGNKEAFGFGRLKNSFIVYPYGKIHSEEVTLKILDHLIQQLAFTSTQIKELDSSYVFSNVFTNVIDDHEYIWFVVNMNSEFRDQYSNLYIKMVELDSRENILLRLTKGSSTDFLYRGNLNQIAAGNYELSLMTSLKNNEAKPLGRFEVHKNWNRELGNLKANIHELQSLSPLVFTYEDYEKILPWYLDNQLHKKQFVQINLYQYGYFISIFIILLFLEWGLRRKSGFS